MPKVKFMLRCAVYLALIKDGKILLLRRLNTGYWDGNYSMIAGHLDGNETIAHATAREAKEEAGIDIREKDLKILHMMHRICPDIEYIDYYLKAEKWTGEVRNMEPHKCDDLNWFPLDALPETTIPYIRVALENIRAGTNFSEYKGK